MKIGETWKVKKNFWSFYSFRINKNDVGTIKDIFEEKGYTWISFKFSKGSCGNFERQDFIKNFKKVYE